MASRKTAARKTGKSRTSGRARGPARKAPPRRKPAAPPTPAPAPREAPEALALAHMAADAALDKKAEHVVILDVRGLTSYADYFVVASGTSDRQVTAIADNVDQVLRDAGHRPNGVEGYTRGHWVLIDFGDVVCHVFYEEARAFYDLEGLWADAARIPVA